MPWIVDKLSIHQIEFLAEIMNYDKYVIQKQLADDCVIIMWRSGEIVHEENCYEKNSDGQFNSARRAMALIIMERYGHSKDKWAHIDNNDNKSIKMEEEVC